MKLYKVVIRNVDGTETDRSVVCDSVANVATYFDFLHRAEGVKSEVTRVELIDSTVFVVGDES